MYRTRRTTVDVFERGKRVEKVAREAEGVIHWYWSHDTRWNTDVYNDIVHVVNDQQPPL